MTFGRSGQELWNFLHQPLPFFHMQVNPNKLCIENLVFIVELSIFEIFIWNFGIGCTIRSKFDMQDFLSSDWYFKLQKRIFKVYFPQIRVFDRFSKVVKKILSNVPMFMKEQLWNSQMTYHYNHLEVIQQNFEYL